MTEFKFIVSDIISAKETIKKINAKFNKNAQAKKILYRKITQDKQEKDIFTCEFIFPFPDLRVPAWFFLAFSLIIYPFFLNKWVFIPSIIVIFVAYRTQYMTSSHYYYKMLVKGMKKNGYKGKIERIK